MTTTQNNTLANREEQENEIDALKSIFWEELKELETSPNFRFQVLLREDLWIDFELPGEYPNEKPKISFPTNSHMSALELELLQYLNERAGEILGSIMIFSLVSLAKTFIEEWEAANEEKKRQLAELAITSNAQVANGDASTTTSSVEEAEEGQEAMVEVLEQKRFPEIQTKRTLLLMMGGTLYDESRADKRLLKRMMSSKASVQDKEKIETDTKRWNRDYQLIQKALTSGVGNDIQIFASVPPQAKSLKHENEQLLQSYFAQPANRYVIYWSGHGEPDTGDWCFSTQPPSSVPQSSKPSSNDHSLVTFKHYDNFSGKTADHCRITLIELLHMWQQGIGHYHGKELIIISDSCYSGSWVQQLKAFYEGSFDYTTYAPRTFTSKHPNFKFQPTNKIIIQAGCRHNEEAWIEETAGTGTPSTNPTGAAVPSTLLMRKMLVDMVTLASSKSTESKKSKSSTTSSTLNPASSSPTATTTVTLNPMKVSQESSFIWGYSKQHPTFYISPSFSADTNKQYSKVPKITIRETEVGEVYAYIPLCDSKYLRLTQINQHWKISMDAKQASFYDERNNCIRTMKGTFFKDF